MPIYEYHCEPCDHTFETLIRGNSDVARCPHCGNIEVAKQFSVPRRRTPAVPGVVSCRSPMAPAHRPSAVEGLNVRGACARAWIRVPRLP